MGINALLPGDVVYRSIVNVSAAQLKTLKATPVVIVPNAAPLTIAEPNIVIVPVSLSLHYFFKTAAFTLNAGTLELYYGPVANGNALCADQSAIITNVANEVDVRVALIDPGVLTEAAGLNMPLVLGNAGAAEFTVGGGSLTVAVTYMPLAI